VNRPVAKSPDVNATRAKVRIGVGYLELHYRAEAFTLSS